MSAAAGTAPGASLTPEQVTDEALLQSGAGSSPLAGATPEQQVDAALVGLSGAATAPSRESEADSDGPSSESEANALVVALANEIVSAGPTAASVYSLLSASATYSLTRT